MSKLQTFLWFNWVAEEAVEFYKSIFPDLIVNKTVRYGAAFPERDGQVLTIDFHLFGQPFVAMNAGSDFKFSPAISFMILCEDQAEVDRYWSALLDGGTPMACGWITDRFGVTWQITPRALMEWMQDEYPARAQRVTEAMMGMVKLDIEGLRKAYDAQP